MIAFLRGKLLNSDLEKCIVDVQGVGYELNIPLSTRDKLPLDGEEVAFFVTTLVREDAITLYGFASVDEKRLFDILIQHANGVGGKLALNILGSMDPGSFGRAVVNGDLKILSCISGVGKRTAERLIVDLKNKLADFHAESDSTIPVASKTPAAEDAVSALTQLGFKRESALLGVQKLLEDSVNQKLSSEELLRLALTSLSR